MSLVVRKAHMKDALAIAEVHVRTWQALYGGLIDQTYLNEMTSQERLKIWQENLAKTGKSYTVFVAEGDGNILGFSTLGSAGKNHVEMYSIYLDPGCHGRGIGRALFQESLSWGQGLSCSKFSAWVFQAYNPGHEFYKRMGGRLISGSEKDLVIDGTLYPIVRYEWAL
ncbi:MAG: GNAT family N-acetyltransferase [Alphaproteobacteria bacterium]